MSAATANRTLAHFRLETIRLAANPEYGEAIEPTTALVIGQFGAHPAVDDGAWVVTHLPSGYSVPTRDALSWHEALRFARALSEVADWPPSPHLCDRSERRKFAADAGKALESAGIATLVRRQSR